MYNVSHANSVQDRRDRYFMSGVMENIMFISTTLYVILKRYRESAMLLKINAFIKNI